MGRVGLPPPFAFRFFAYCRIRRVGRAAAERKMKNYLRI